MTASSALLSCAGRPVGRYTYLPATEGRPYFHPVTTLAGVPVTEERPADHLHHLGTSIAVPDVAGHNFWGGRTFVRGQGPTALDNHGIQRHLGWKLRDSDGFVEELSWVADDTELLREHRTVAVAELSGTAWALDFSFSLTNRGSDDLSIGSPATNGRPGAGYGGFFWRAPKEPAAPTVFSGVGDGEEAVHGRVADWVAMTGDGWTLVFSRRDRRDPARPVVRPDRPVPGCRLVPRRRRTTAGAGRCHRRTPCDHRHRRRPH